MVGDFKTDNIKAQDGTASITIDNTTGKANFAGVIKIVGGTPGTGKKLESAADGTASWTTNSIPTGEIILFEKDTAVTGFTLLTTEDDGVVYITKGSVAGGESGASDKTSGTWTQPNHTHTGPSHTHTGGSVGLSIAQLAAHTHSTTLNRVEAGVYSSSPGSGGNSIQDTMISGSTGSGATHSHGATSAGGTGATSAGGTGATSAGGTNATGSDGTGATSSGATANTWRPVGRNFTRQQKT